jgi:hypothetical protein
MHPALLIRYDKYATGWRQQLIDSISNRFLQSAHTGRGSFLVSYSMETSNFPRGTEWPQCEHVQSPPYSVDVSYGLDSTRIEFRWWRNFSHPSRPPLSSNQPPTQWVPGHSRGSSARSFDHPTPSSAEVKERVHLYLYSLLGLRGLF